MPDTSLPWQRAAARALDRCPALGRHELGPAPVELPMVALAHAEVAGPGLEIRVEALMAQPHLCVQRVPAGDHPTTGARALLPVVHVVLFESPRGAKAPHPSQPYGFLDLWRRSSVRVDPRPDLGLIRPPWVPDTEGAGGGAEQGEVREHRAHDGVDEARPRT